MPSTHLISKTSSVTPPPPPFLPTPPHPYILAFWQQSIFTLFHGKFKKICPWEHFERCRPYQLSDGCKNYDQINAQREVAIADNKITCFILSSGEIKID